MRSDSPLGRKAAYPRRYAPDVLFPVARADNRRLIGIGDELPFGGEDVWTAWDLTWLGPSGKPVVAAATFRVPASSPCIVESKSLKLYLNALAMTVFDGSESVSSTIAGDLARVCGTGVAVALTCPDAAPDRLASLPGECIDGLDVACGRWQADASLLAAADGEIVTETLHSHLLRSLCPVTGQPDIGSVLLRYRGPRMDRAALLRYLASYREHSGFHEDCVERIFVDLKSRCGARELTVHARYNRRGGIDINPFRSDADGGGAPDLRLWRQ